MKRRDFIKALCAVCVAEYVNTGTAHANRASVEIEAPQEAMSGDEVIIKLTVHHNANNFLHHVNWAYLMAGDREIARWEYGWFSRPGGEDFTREVSYTVNGTVEITGEAHCNIHGSKGKMIHTITLRRA